MFLVQSLKPNCENSYFLHTENIRDNNTTSTSVTKTYIEILKMRIDDAYSFANGYRHAYVSLMITMVI